jgi:hypothetical protein
MLHSAVTWHGLCNKKLPTGVPKVAPVGAKVDVAGVAGEVGGDLGFKPVMYQHHAGRDEQPTMSHLTPSSLQACLLWSHQPTRTTLGTSRRSGSCTLKASGGGSSSGRHVAGSAPTGGMG